MALNVVEIWRDLHKTPELGFEENKTSAYLAEALEKLGFAVTRGVGKTGVMGVIRGAEPGPVLGTSDVLSTKGTVSEEH